MEASVWQGASEEGIAVAAEVGVGATEEDSVEDACRGMGAMPVGTMPG